MTDLDKLLMDHQAIIDAWYAEWRKNMNARIDAFWARKSRERGIGE
jgi:hypothetical protein